MITTLLVFAIKSGIHLFNILEPADEHTNTTLTGQSNTAFSNSLYGNGPSYAPAGLSKLSLEKTEPDG